MARPRGPQQLWPSRGQLYEAPDGGSYRDDDLRRYAGRLVRGIRTGAEPSDCVRLARIGLHSRGLERPAAHRLPVSPANHLEQAAHRFDSHALLALSGRDRDEVLSQAVELLAMREAPAAGR